MEEREAPWDTLLAERGYSPGLHGFHICGRCLGLFEPEREDGHPQRCRCRKRAEERTWPRFDYNERVHLCECCVQHVLPSGSKYSVWFCLECKARVMAPNRRVGFALIPIGPHSFMAGGYLKGTDLFDDAQVDAFTHALFGLIQRMNHLHAFSEASLDSTLRRIGLRHFDAVPLGRYLHEVMRKAEDDSAVDTEQAFMALTDHFALLARLGKRERPDPDD